ncbi:aminopeptidase [Riemerella anatipestifer]|uniref:aminopeptidase n=1 Tax=Riemerella anatipestifer TaxID=34085 RepID=UPI0012AD49BA|nr:aminopeptidase [Riemerella anatipestifer]MCO7318633.1 aminopeptidase [Riemerella anatipestifer]MCQ4154945.1 aminopeptidase [Riemerella anatipestifer]MCQ4180897.1 aminopeptidase [Riemerella anatipestifer]MCW0474114.1 aminopeptidase [Riemerella anatipestifer]MDR7732193.1 aminopeptidase [Riemerella anatipestifer]
MRKVLLLFIVLLSFGSCGRTETVSEENYYDIYKDNKGGVRVGSYFGRELKTGEIVEERLNNSLIHIWEATDKDFDVNKSGTDIISGYLYDRKSEKSYKPVISTLNKASFFETLKEGKYFLYINTGKNDYGLPNFAYSYTYFTVTKGKDTSLKKIFINSDLKYQPW